MTKTIVTLLAAMFMATGVYAATNAPAAQSSKPAVVKKAKKKKAKKAKKAKEEKKEEGAAPTTGDEGKKMDEKKAE